MQRVLTAMAVGTVMLIGSVRAQQDILDRITGTAMRNGGAWQFLTQITDTIGARVTGTPELATAQALISTTLRSGGLDDVWFEEWRLESRWRRGPVDARILGPIERPLAVGAWGWSPGTQGRVTAKVVDLGVVNKTLMTPRSDVRNAAVIMEPGGSDSDTAFVIRTLAARQLAAAGATALIIPSDKPGRMLYTGAFGNYPRAALPMLSLGSEDTSLVRRLLADSTVTVSLQMTNTFEAGVMERNVLADLRGATAPEEVVLVGAHLDSWDPAQGALDNGAGVAALVEAARILRALGIRPRRTIRFAFWSGEEQAILGSAAYVDRHRDELSRMRAVINFDHGPQEPRGFLLQGRSDLVPSVRRLLTPLAALGVTEVLESGSFDTDHAFFAAAGVPTLDLAVDPGEYDIHHHAVTDTLDKVDRRLLALNTAVVATVAWVLADSDEPLPHMSASAAAQLMERLGFASSYRLLLGRP